MKPTRITYRIITSLLFACSLLATTKGVEKVEAKNSAKKEDFFSQKEPWKLFDGRLVFSGQERLRWEIRENMFDFDNSTDSVTDDEFVLQRFRFGLTAKPADGMTLMGEGQDVREWDSKRPNVPGVLGAEGDDEFDFRQGWALLGDIKTFPVTFKVGRMTWNYGDQRLIGDFDWNNFGRTFDGFVGHMEAQGYNIDVFYGSPVVIKPSAFNEDDGHDRVLGVYFTTKEWLGQFTDLYTIYRKHENNVNNGQAQETWTPGVRFKSNRKDNWDYEVELAGQAGKVNVTPQNSVNHYAFASHLQAGYTWKDVMTSPRLGGFYDFASGDDNPNDSTDTSFQNLFPTNHKFYGSMDLFAWRNIHDFGISVGCQPVANLTTKVEVHSFWLDATQDAWYRANGFTTVRPAAAGRDIDSHVGEELDFTVNWKLNQYLQVGAGVGQFWTGEFVSKTGASSDAQFGYLMLTASF